MNRIKQKSFHSTKITRPLRHRFPTPKQPKTYSVPKSHHERNTKSRIQNILLRSNKNNNKLETNHGKTKMKNTRKNECGGEFNGVEGNAKRPPLSLALFSPLSFPGLFWKLRRWQLNYIQRENYPFMYYLFLNLKLVDKESKINNKFSYSKNNSYSNFYTLKDNLWTKSK